MHTVGTAAGRRSGRAIEERVSAGNAAAADAETPAFGIDHGQRAELAAQAAPSGQVAHHGRLGVLERRHLEQGLAAARRPVRVGPVQHQALAALPDHFAEQRVQLISVSHTTLRHDPYPVGTGVPLDRFQALEPRTEIAVGARQFEQHVAHLPPVRLVRQLPAYEARQRVEAPAGHPQFAVERQCRQRPGEPRRRRDALAIAQPQCLAVPARAYAIQFFAHPVGRRIDTGGRTQRQHRRQRIGGSERGQQQADAAQQDAHDRYSTNELRGLSGK